MDQKQTSLVSPEATFPRVDLLPLDDDVRAMVSESIQEANDAPSEEARDVIESQVLGFVEQIDHKEELLEEFRGWFAAACGRQDDVPEGIATFLNGLRPEQTVKERKAPTKREIIDRFETDNFVAETPRFAEILKDTSRSTPFEYDSEVSTLNPHERGSRIANLTEHQGLVELDSFLSGYIERASSKRAQNVVGYKTDVAQAKSMRENLTFIGSKEFVEATRGLSVLWKHYLDGDPARQICLITEAASLPRYSREAPGVPKSDSFIAEVVKRQLLAMDKGYRRQIVNHPSELKVPADKARVIIVDDWTVSGGQVFDVCSKLLKDPAMSRYRGSMEINLLVAPRNRIEDGLSMPFQPDVPPITVRGYYRAYDAPASVEKTPCHITGLHSTVNMGFSFTLDSMTKKLNATRSPMQARFRMPALASVYRAYWRTLPNYLAHHHRAGKQV